MNSLRVRFLLISALSVALALTAAGFIMIRLFEKNLERRVETELTNYVNQIAVELVFDDKGQLLPPKNLLDRRFNLAYSGLYWQIDDLSEERQLRSRSLWDFALPLPDNPHGAGEVHRYFLDGPEESTVIVEERELIVATPHGVRSIRISAAMNYETITSARSQFTMDMIPYLFVLGIFLLLSLAVQMTLGFKPLRNVQTGLIAVRERKKLRLEGDFPTEIKPLTETINQLLASQEETIDRARKQAANLAHGLKTPLTVLTNDARKLEALGEVEMALELQNLAKTMRMHVDYELARSRITPEQNQRKSDGNPSQIIAEIINTLKRAPKGEDMQWSIAVPDHITVTVDPDDLRELIGNIVENALKWAKTMVNITGKIDGVKLLLSIEDDGTGLEPKLIDSILQRGIRHDQKTPGSGIGLSLVQEICAVYYIGLTIENRQSHGLCVTLEFEIAQGKSVNRN